MRRLERILLAGALSLASLLGTQSCLSPTNLLCSTQGAGQTSGAPCDIFGAGDAPCVAAFSTTRVLYRSYAGPLYQVTRKSDGTATNVGVLSDGYANAAGQDAFCANSTCTITRIYDQSPHHNDLTVSPPGGAAKGAGPGGDDLPAVAGALPVTAGGHTVYGVDISPGTGYRNDATVGVAVNGQPEGVYMVASGTHINPKCCFDFGNAEKDALNHGQGHMDAISLRCTSPCNPFVGLDMEDGTYPLFAIPTGIPFVTAMGANDGQQSYTIYWGNAQARCLTTAGSRALPKGYSPMHQEGAIILGTGGDNSNWGEGSFFEGAMTAGVPSSATMVAVQANIVLAGYAGNSGPNPADVRGCGGPTAF